MRISINSELEPIDALRLLREAGFEPWGGGKLGQRRIAPKVTGYSFQGLDAKSCILFTRTVTISRSAFIGWDSSASDQTDSGVVVSRDPTWYFAFEQSADGKTMTKKRMVLEIGMGTDIRGADPTKAACRALRDALWHNSLSIARALGHPLEAMIVGNHGQLVWQSLLADDIFDEVIRLRLMNGIANMDAFVIFCIGQAGRSPVGIEDDSRG